MRAAEKLVYLLAARDDMEGLRAPADAGNRDIFHMLPELLAGLLNKQGRAEEAERVRRVRLESGRVNCLRVMSITPGPYRRIT